MMSDRTLLQISNKLEWLRNVLALQKGKHPLACYKLQTAVLIDNEEALEAIRVRKTSAEAKERDKENKHHDKEAKRQGKEANDQMIRESREQQKQARQKEKEAKQQEKEAKRQKKEAKRQEKEQAKVTILANARQRTQTKHQRAVSDSEDSKIEEAQSSVRRQLKRWAQRQARKQRVEEVVDVANSGEDGRDSVSDTASVASVILVRAS
ncbi:hypothetical protein BDZ91DRAFT_257175 [Kalaharituber pfeilii]|nr:hypothetical protein BDZ91DRAFT_257175 [Kalaharituber pfeilii]